MTHTSEGVVSWMPLSMINVPAGRQRQLFKKEAHDELVRSIREDGLISPLVLNRDPRNQFDLVAGERRLRACREIMSDGVSCVRLVDGRCEQGCVPVIVIQDQPDRVRRRIELSENIQRLDLTWQERLRATNEVAELFRLDEPEILNSAIAERAGLNHASVRDRQLIGQFMHLPEVGGAPSEKDAKKAVARHLENALHHQLALAKLKEDLASDESPASRHTLLQGDCAQVLAGFPPEVFDVVLTDPPYGVDAHKFSHDGSMPVQHGYDDSAKTMEGLLAFLPAAITRVAKPQAHLYLFCDIAYWLSWKVNFAARGWDVYERPLIWVKGETAEAAAGPVGNAMLWPSHAYECVLYAVRGRKPTQGKLATDVLAYAGVRGRKHAAQKPVALYEDLLRRSVLLNDRVLDCFCGSGTIFEAADRVGVVATGVDREIALAQRRLAGERECES